MIRKADYIKKRFSSLQDKTLKNALAHRIGTEFPRLGGPRILHLCADMVLEVIETHMRATEHLTHGQILWMGVSVDDPPAEGKRIRDTRLVPVVMTLSTPGDVQERIDRISKAQRLQRKAVRLCTEAFRQGALLSNSDLAEMLNLEDSTVSKLLTDYERDTNRVVPRRATLHDMGTGITHKRIICWKRYVEGKNPERVARETYHSLEAVERYLSQFDRVRHCRQQGMNPEEIAYVLKCSRRLVDEYIHIDTMLEQDND